uniref:Oligopeptide ABC transporter, ATP-binding protein n=1 Tax=Clostridioides difficile TaxID=1496 RepID=A0A381I687_CLODI|nr:oligopeptide ABC transporter, ATP-binding protein [Clostridioides difficile]
MEVNNLSVSFKVEEGEVQAVRNVSFNLKKGETLAIVGESGCGKSVLCKSLMRILPYNGYIKNGEVLLKSSDLVKKSEKEMEDIRGKNISMIFQDPMTSLNPTISIGKQIAEAVIIHQGISKSEAKKRAIELIELVGIDNPEKRFKQFPHHFSGGMRQRIVIAIALACNPDVLIADEPTTALDVTIQAQIIDLIKDLQHKIGLSIIFITHDLGVVATIADRIAVMYAGKIVEIGTVEDIFYDPRHPYTWGLLGSLPTLDSQDDYLYKYTWNASKFIEPTKRRCFCNKE